MDSPNEFFYQRKLNRDEDGQILFAGNGGNGRKEPVSNTPAYVVVNPLAETIEEGESILERIQSAADHYATCIATERQWHGSLREAEATYEIAEMEAVAETIAQGQIKEGPLAGLATSSKAYDAVLNYERIKLRTGKLSRQWQSLERVRHNYETSQVDLRQAETQFTAMRKVCELKAELVRAATL